MPSLNSCSFAGHLGRDVEMRYTPSGKAIAEMSIGVTTGREQYKRTDWVKLTCFGTQAEAVANYKKGDGIVATNVEYKQDVVEKDGKKITYHGFVCGFGGVVLGYLQGQFKNPNAPEKAERPQAASTRPAMACHGGGMAQNEADQDQDNLPF